LTPFKALTGGTFDRLNWQHSGEFDQNFQKSQMPGGLPGGGGMGGFGIDRYISHDYYRKEIYIHVELRLQLQLFFKGSEVSRSEVSKSEFSRSQFSRSEV